jgi:phosphoribosylaminoimidazole carboxylase
VGINNSVNAALLAIGSLGAFIPAFHEKMKIYQIQIEKQVEDKASLLREIDVEAYLARINNK